MERANFFRKMINLEELEYWSGQNQGQQSRGELFRIQKMVELDADKYNYFINHFTEDTDFIIELNKTLEIISDNIVDCIYVKQKGSSYGILVDSQKYDYARYTAIYREEKEQIESPAAEISNENSMELLDKSLNAFEERVIEDKLFEAIERKLIQK